MSIPVASVVHFRPAPPLDAFVGNLGVATLQIDSLLVAGVAVHRDPAGRHVLVFPSHRTVIVEPVDPAARAAIHEQILDALVASGAIAPSHDRGNATQIDVRMAPAAPGRIDVRSSS